MSRPLTFKAAFALGGGLVLLVRYQSLHWNVKPSFNARMCRISTSGAWKDEEMRPVGPEGAEELCRLRARRAGGPLDGRDYALLMGLMESYREQLPHIWLQNTKSGDEFREIPRDSIEALSRARVSLERSRREDGDPIE